MRKVILFCFILMITPLFTSCTNQKEEPSSYSIAIISLVEIDPVIELRNGFKDYFIKSDFAKKNKIEFIEYNAQNDASITNQIIDKLLVNKPNMIYALGTPIAQGVQKRLPDTLLIQGAGTDPIAAGLADSWDASGRNFVATTDLPPVSKQLDLIAQLTPSIRRLGIIYNPGEVNSVAVVSRIRTSLKKDGRELVLVERSVSNSSEVATAAQSLIGNVDAIYVPPDNTVHAAIPVVGKFAKEFKIPFYATVSSAIDDGALATLSLDFYALGEDSAKLALRVLNGEDPAKLPIIPLENPKITINKKIADELGLDTNLFSNNPNYFVQE